MAPQPSAPKAGFGPSRISGLIDAGVWLQLAGDFTGARDVFRRALEREPTNQRVQQLYEQCLATLQGDDTIPPSAGYGAERATPLPSAPVASRATPVPQPVPRDEMSLLPSRASVPSATRPQAQGSRVSLAAQSPKSMRSIHDELLRIAKALRAQGDVDEASGLVLRALLIDDASLDAYEAAYVLLREQERDEAASAAIVKFVKLCVLSGEVERARKYLPTLGQMRFSNPKIARLAAELVGDADDTLPPTIRDVSRRYDQPTVLEPSPFLTDGPSESRRR